MVRKGKSTIDWMAGGRECMIFLRRRSQSASDSRIRALEMLWDIILRLWLVKFLDHEDEGRMAKGEGERG